MSEKHFEAVIIDTTDVKKELGRICAQNEASAEFIDFEIISSIFIYKIGEEKTTIKEDKFGIFDDDEFYLNPKLTITQAHKIRFFDRRDEILKALPDVKVAVNKKLTKVVAIVKQNDKFLYYDDFKENLAVYINKKLVLSNIFIGIRNKEMFEGIEDIALCIGEKNCIDKDYQFTITSGIEPINCIDAQLVFHYKDKLKKHDIGDNIDYSKRGFLTGVAKGDEIIEFLKPKEGKPGRNIFGKYIDIKKPVASIDGNLSISENIAKEENDDCIKYIALKAGYVCEEGGRYDIKEEYEIQDLSFKKTGSVYAGIDNNVKLNITQKDINKDSVGSNISIETSEIVISGSVGQEAKIKANVVEIGGVTHSTSLIEAKKAKISTHIGTLIADEVEIINLEGGKVIAQNVRVGTALGGEITAQNVYIENLISNVKITASNIIEIKTNRGSANRLIIDPASIRNYGEKIKSNQEKIEILTKKIDETYKELQKNKKVIDDNQNSINTIKTQIKKLKDSNLSIPNLFVIKIKEFQTLIKSYNEFVILYKKDKKELEMLHFELKELQGQIFKAKIIISGTFQEFNDITFVLIDPPISVNYTTTKTNMSNLYKLEEIGNEKYSIYKGIQSDKGN